MKKFSYESILAFFRDYHKTDKYYGLRMGQAFVNEFSIGLEDETDNIYELYSVPMVEQIILRNYVDYDLK